MTSQGKNVRACATEHLIHNLNQDWFSIDDAGNAFHRLLGCGILKINRFLPGLKEVAGISRSARKQLAEMLGVALDAPFETHPRGMGSLLTFFYELAYEIPESISNRPLSGIDGLSGSAGKVAKQIRSVALSS